MRNGMKAFDYATKACELSDWKEYAQHRHPCRACAEDGDFDQAVKWETKYIAEAKPPDKDAPLTPRPLPKSPSPYHQQPAPAAVAPD